jgi:predicted nucleic acid-binding protein
VIIADSNILIDVLDHDPHWYDWSTEKMGEAGNLGRVAINHIILAEVAPFAGDLSDFIAILDAMGLEIEPLCNQSAYLAGGAFREYRKRRDISAPKSILPDFLIGGHAQILGATILTRDPRFYRAYFPEVPLITPSKEEE